MTPRRRIPVATLRLQLHEGFRFTDVRRVVPYVHDLGVSDVYLSPVFRARTGSQHGYDIVDPRKIDERLGGEEEFRQLAADLRQRRMGLLLDVVPNHMAATAENPWWRDVLVHGEASTWARTFDIDWSGGGDPLLRGRVLLPVLGTPFGESLAKREIRLERRDEDLQFRYYDHVFPVDPGSWVPLLVELARGASEDLRRRVRRWIREVRRVPAREAGHVGERAGVCERIRSRIRTRLRRAPGFAEDLDRVVAAFNGAPGPAAAEDPLRELLTGQAYVLVHWKSAAERINYRRFFDIADLVGVRVEDPSVFDETHRLLRHLVQRGEVTGIRVDHVDGLLDPVGYLERLQRAVGGGRRDRRFYVLVEKILSHGEDLATDWPVFGTTGYEFTDAANAVFVDGRGLRLMDRTYRRFTALRTTFRDRVYEQKRRLLSELFAADLRRVARQLHGIARADPRGRKIPEEDLDAALAEVTACLPVYRTYVRNGGLSGDDRQRIRRAFREARRRASGSSTEAFNFLEGVFRLDRPTRHGDSREAALGFLLKWQQLTGPLTAKGVEDTVLYQYGRLLSLNVVGGTPDTAPERLTAKVFHEFNRRRAKLWPHGLNATSTHDSKRSEDVRARLHVLSDVPKLWSRAVHRWHRENRRHRFRLGGRLLPDPNDEFFLYQTLVGAWPFDKEELAGFSERIEAYALKAAREAKVHTSWLERDAAYEEGLVYFVRRVLDPIRNRRFRTDLEQFVARIAFHGAVNSLSQVILKTGSPGIPDFYQGEALWDLSLVDPDNRRPVDFEHRASMLAGLRDASRGDPRSLAEELVTHWRDGRIKMYVTLRALAVRHRQRTLFNRGRYVPLDIGGARSRHVLAFARNDDRRWALFVVPVGLAQLGEGLVSPDAWKGTAVRLPGRAPLRWRNVFTDEALRADRRRGLFLRDVFATFPVAILESA